MKRLFFLTSLLLSLLLLLKVNRIHVSKKLGTCHHHHHAICGVFGQPPNFLPQPDTSFWALQKEKKMRICDENMSFVFIPAVTLFEI